MNELDPLLDEDGRCRRTELLPDACGCAGHRGGEVIDLQTSSRALLEDEDVDTSGLLIHRFKVAAFQSRCALTRNHSIQPGDEIGLAVQEDDLAKQIGWVCSACLLTIIA